jgi:hypothetical protein
MSDALAAQLARALNIPPDAARHTLNHLVAALHEQLDATGRASVPGLGTFLREGAGLAFRPDDALARAVNHRYAGLQPIEAEPRKATAGPEPDDPFAGVDLSTPSEPASSPRPPVEFQPLGSIVAPEESEPEEESDYKEESDYDEADEVGEADEAPTALAFDGAPAEPAGAEPVDAEGVQESPEKEQPDGEASETDEGEPHRDIIAVGPEDGAPPAEEPSPPTPVSPAGIDPTDLDPTDRDGDEYASRLSDERDEAAVEPVFAGFETHPDDTEPEASEPVEEPVDETEAGATEETLGADEEGADEEGADELDDLNDLITPAAAVGDDDVADDLDPASIFPSAPVSEEAAVPAPSSDAGEPPADARAVAPAVAATSSPAPDREPVDPARRRGVPVFGIVVGLAMLLGIVALLWLLNREPEGPALAERPVPADTTTAIAGALSPTDDATAASTPADTAAAAQPPADSAPSADPLRGGDGIDRADGGFSWVVGSELSREPAERRVAAFRAQGLRAGVIAEEAAGRTRFRVALGQFESIEQAERFRSDLPAGVPADTWLLRL